MSLYSQGRKFEDSKEKDQHKRRESQKQTFGGIRLTALQLSSPVDAPTHMASNNLFNASFLNISGQPKMA